MEQSPDAGVAARGGKRAGQLDVRALERRVRMLVQHADEIDRRRHAACVTRERRGIVRIGFDDLNGGQRQKMTRPRATPREHNREMAGGRLVQIRPLRL